MLISNVHVVIVVQEQLKRHACEKDVFLLRTQ